MSRLSAEVRRNVGMAGHTLMECSTLKNKYASVRKLVKLTLAEFVHKSSYNRKQEYTSKVDEYFVTGDVKQGYPNFFISEPIGL
jgi:hypothetical protein